MTTTPATHVNISPPNAHCLPVPTTTLVQPNVLLLYHHLRPNRLQSGPTGPGLNPRHRLPLLRAMNVGGNPLLAQHHLRLHHHPAKSNPVLRLRLHLLPRLATGLLVPKNVLLPNRFAKNVTGNLRPVTRRQMMKTATGSLVRISALPNHRPLHLHPRNVMNVNGISPISANQRKNLVTLNGNHLVPRTVLHHFQELLRSGTVKFKLHVIP